MPIKEILKYLILRKKFKAVLMSKLLFNENLIFCSIYI
jgi:hypothetical protein